MALSGEMSAAQARSKFSEVVGRAMYAGERIGLTRKGKLSAVVISVEDYEALESYEMAQDIAAYDEAKAEDDGSRVSLADLREELDALSDV